MANAPAAADDFVAPPGLKTHLDLKYGDLPRHTLDVYLPKGRKKLHKALVWVHGGAWRLRDKKAIRTPWVLDHGYALVSINYRLTGAGPMPIQIQDVNRALSWLSKHGKDYGVDSRRMVIGGASAGGHLVAMAALARKVPEFGSDPKVKIAGVVDMYGPADLLAMCMQTSEGNDHDAPDAPEADLIGGAVRAHPDKAIWASPTTYVTKNAPPFIFLHGSADPIVPFAQSVLLEGHLRVKGVNTEFHKIEGAGHGGPHFLTQPVKDAVNGFLDRIYGK